MSLFYDTINLEVRIMIIEQLKAMHDFTNNEKAMAGYLIKTTDDIFHFRLKN